MKAICCLLTFFLALVFAAVTGFSQDDSLKQTGDQLPELGPPPQIKTLAFMEGDWIFKGRMRTDPNSEWVENEGKATMSYVAGGGAIMMEYSSTMMGMEMRGVGLTAYDRELGEWQDAWIDNIASRISVYTGKDQDGKKVVSGKDMMGGQTAYTRITTYEMTATVFKWMMEMSTDGESWFVTMEGEYTKQ
jgi:hypothetical protein